MSRTYYLPITITLDGDPASGIPPNLLFRDQADTTDPAIPRTISRLLFPRQYAYVAEVYNQADQVIGTLGAIDPVQLWERSGSAGDRNAPDDFIATVSVHGPTGDTTGIAQVTIIDGNLRPRSAPFLLGSSPAAPYATRYGIPLFTGDQLLFSWQTEPNAGTSGFVTVNLTPCDGCELQRAAAAWVSALKDCCAEVAPSCLLPSAAEVTDNIGGATSISIGSGIANALAVLVPPGTGVYQLDVTMAATFDPADYTFEVLVDGVAIPLGFGPNFASVAGLPVGPAGTQDTWHVEFTLSTPIGPDLVELRVTETADPSCVFTQGFLLVTGGP